MRELIKGRRMWAYDDVERRWIRRPDLKAPIQVMRRDTEPGKASGPLYTVGFKCGACGCYLCECGSDDCRGRCVACGAKAVR